MNKRSICHFFICLIFSTELYAQDSISSNVNNIVSESIPASENRYLAFGVRYMPTFSSFNIQNSEGEIKGDFVMSHGVEGLLGFGITKHLGAQVEVMYNTYSQKYKDKELERRIDINYVNLPLLLVLNTNKMNAVNLNFAFGPQIGVNVGSKITTTEPSNGIDTVNAVLAIKQGDLGIAYGAGLDFAINAERTMRLDIGFRGVMGLVDISDRSKTLVTNEYYVLQKSHVLSYSGYIGFTFLF